MTSETSQTTAEATKRPIAWVVPGPLRQLTGGYLYDARIVDGLRSRGWAVGVVDVRSSDWPLDPRAARRLVTALRRERWAAVVVDELCHPSLVAALASGGRRHVLGDAPLVLLVHHLRSSEPVSWGSRAVTFAVEAVAVRSADLVICTSETTARTVRPLARPGVPVQVVRPGWDTHVLNPRPLAPASLRLQGQLPPPDSPTSRTLDIAIDAPCHPELAKDLIDEHDGLGDPSLRSQARSAQDDMEGARSAAIHELTVGPVDHPCPGIESGEARSGCQLRLLLVGHWTPRKGILEALAALARLGPGVTLDLVGEQDRDPAYATRVLSAMQDAALAGRVCVHGCVSATALASLYARADALLLPSTHEGYGMVLAEALAAGLPIVATRVGAVPEVVRDGFEADLVRSGDVEALARAIARLAADPAERRRRSKLARERSRTLPRWSESVVAFERQLLALLARTVPGR